MNIIGLGTDIVEIERIEKAMNKTEKFMEKVFSPVEIEYCQKKINKYGFTGSKKEVYGYQEAVPCPGAADT